MVAADIMNCVLFGHRVEIFFESEAFGYKCCAFLNDEINHGVLQKNIK